MHKNNKIQNEISDSNRLYYTLLYIAFQNRMKKNSFKKYEKTV